MKKLFYYLLIMSVLGIGSTACQKQTSYPCPGLGQSSESDYSLFTDDGQMKDSKDSKSKKKKNNGRRVNHDTGLVNKKSPKEIHTPRKTKL